MQISWNAALHLFIFALIIFATSRNLFSDISVAMRMQIQIQIQIEMVTGGMWYDYRWMEIHLVCCCLSFEQFVLLLLLLDKVAIVLCEMRVLQWLTTLSACVWYWLTNCRFWPWANSRLDRLDRTLSLSIRTGIDLGKRPCQLFRLLTKWQSDCQLVEPFVLSNFLSILTENVKALQENEIQFIFRQL